MKKAFLIIFAVLLFLLAATFVAGAQENPACFRLEDQIARTDKAIKDKIFERAVIFLYNSSETEQYTFILIDASGEGAAFRFVNGCMMPWPEGSAIRTFEVANEQILTMLGKSEAIFEGGDVKEFLKLRGKTGGKSA